MKIHIRTPSRLHFGLISLPAANASAWLNQDGEPTLPRRNFGGVGLMIDRPGIELTVEPAKTWSVEGVLAARALRFAQVYCESAGIKDSFQLRIESAAPEHAGLGTGTQLGLAVARAIATLADLPRDSATLARHVQRGLRSALGVHGFAQGGFLVEAGKTSDISISPLLHRGEFPQIWQILLITPRDLVGTHGRIEIDAFADLANETPDERTTDNLCRLILLGMLPALAEGNLRTFGEALYDFNRRVGGMFRHAQGGFYAHPRIEKIVKSIRDFGVRGVGQSSWGPTVFALANAEEIGSLKNWVMLTHGIANEETNIAVACNRGAVLSIT